MVRNLLVLLSTIFVVVNAFNNHNENHGGYPTWFPKSNHMLLSKFKDVVQPNVTVWLRTLVANLRPLPKLLTHTRLKVEVDTSSSSMLKPVSTMSILPLLKTRIIFSYKLYGDGPAKTIITGSKSLNKGASKTMDTATFSTLAKDFIAKSITFQNTAGHEAGPAVALHVKGDRSTFFDCGIHGYQETLYVHTLRQFYCNCEISGHSTTLIQNSKIIVRKPGPDHGNVVVADGTKEMNAVTRIVLQNCSIMPSQRCHDLDLASSQ
ncbi:pectinesterase [Trifolium repens]|nr:pectinesterase [Trifolium repens]